jgi:hypothetical protein
MYQYGENGGNVISWRGCGVANGISAAQYQPWRKIIS